MDVINALDVFKDKAPGPRASPVPGVDGLFIEPLSVLAPGAHIFAASFFLFPKRAEGPRGFEYGGMVDMFMNGLRISIENMKYFPAWTYRLYVDYSVCAPYDPASSIAAIAKKARAEIQALVKTHAKRVQIVGVRYVPHLPGTTFLPAIWRFLPIADPSVALFSCWDVDSPPHPLIVHYIEQWHAASAPANNILFSSLEVYRPPQCAAYVATHMRSPTAGIHSQCPIAQGWAGHPHADGNAIVVEMMALAHNAPLKQMLAGANVEEMQKLAETLRAMPLQPSRGNSFEAKLEPFVENIQRLAATGPAWLAPAASNRDVAEFAALVLYRRTLLRQLPQSPIRALFESNMAWKRIAKIRTIALESDYGVDEWVQHIIYEHALQSNGYSWLRLATPEAGVFQVNHDPTIEEPPPPEVPQLPGLLKLMHPGMQPEKAVHHYTQMFMKTAALVHMFRPAATSALPAVSTYYNDIVQVYTQRIELLLGKKGKAVTDLVRAGFAPENGAVIAKYAATEINVKDPSAFSRFTGGAAFHSNDFTVHVNSPEALIKAFEIMVRCLFLGMFEVFAVLPSASVPLRWV